MALIVDGLVRGEERWPLVWAFSASLIFLVYVRHNYQQMNSITFLEIRQSLVALIYQKVLNLDLRSVRQYARSLL